MHVEQPVVLHSLQGQAGPSRRPVKAGRPCCTPCRTRQQRLAQAYRAGSQFQPCAGPGSRAKPAHTEQAHLAHLAGPVFAEEVADDALLAFHLCKELLLAVDFPVLTMPAHKPLLGQKPKPGQQTFPAAGLCSLLPGGSAQEQHVLAATELLAWRREAAALSWLMRCWRKRSMPSSSRFSSACSWLSS